MRGKVHKGSAVRPLAVLYARRVCILRHLPESDAHTLLDTAIPHKDKLIAVGLDSSELGHPPAKFVAVMARAKEVGHGVSGAHPQGRCVVESSVRCMTPMEDLASL